MSSNNKYPVNYVTDGLLVYVAPNQISFDTWKKHWAKTCTDHISKSSEIYNVESDLRLMAIYLCYVRPSRSVNFQLIMKGAQTLRANLPKKFLRFTKLGAFNEM